MAVAPTQSSPSGKSKLKIQDKSLPTVGILPPSRLGSAAGMRCEDHARVARHFFTLGESCCLNCSGNVTKGIQHAESMLYTVWHGRRLPWATPEPRSLGINILGGAVAEPRSPDVMQIKTCQAESGASGPCHSLPLHPRKPPCTPGPSHRSILSPQRKMFSELLCDVYLRFQAKGMRSYESWLRMSVWSRQKGGFACPSACGSALRFASPLHIINTTRIIRVYDTIFPLN